MKIVLGSYYAANVDYYTCVNRSEGILIDVCDHYKKQTYRNRTSIYGANGKLDLIIPIQRRLGKTHIKDIKIDYDQRWQKIHWKSLESCYRSSPYFEFYEDRFRTLYEQKAIHFLVDFNHQLLETFLKIIGIEKEIKFTTEFNKDQKQHLDYREVICPKNQPSEKYNEEKYSQVFEERYDFIPNLSIFDLIFNQGPLAIQFL